MPFKKGEDPNRAKGGKRAGAGRKTNMQKAQEATEAELARKILAENVQEIMKEYIRLAKGGQALPLGGTAMTKIKDAVGKWIPPAKQEVDVGHGVKILRIIAPKYD